MLQNPYLATGDLDIVVACVGATVLHPTQAPHEPVWHAIASPQPAWIPLK